VFCNFSDVHVIQKVAPTTKDYAVATGKEVLAVLQSAASLIPVPFLGEAIGVAIKVIEICEVRRIPPMNVARPLILIKICARAHRLLKKRSMIFKSGSAIS